MKNGRKRESNTVETVERNGCPKQTPDCRFWKYPKEEEKERELQKRNLNEVKDFQSIKISDEIGDLLEADCPYVSSETVWNDGPVDDDDRWYTGYQCGQDAVVIVPELSDGEHSLVYNPGERADGGDD